MINEIYNYNVTRVKIMRKLIAVCLTVFFSANIIAEVPDLINYQARITDAQGAPKAGPVTLTFALYGSLSGTDLLWGVQTLADTPLNNGYFNVILGGEGGSLSAAMQAEHTYLEITENGIAITPRQRILSAPYALNSDSSSLNNMKGAIMMWSGTVDDRPEGWAICDGTQGTPDLTDRFIVGAGFNYGVGERGGAIAVKLTAAEMPSHNHTVPFESHGNPDGGWDHASTEFYIRSPNIGSSYPDTNYPSSNAGSDGYHENRPPFHALYYIMKL